MNTDTTKKNTLSEKLSLKRWLFLTLLILLLLSLSSCSVLGVILLNNSSPYKLGNIVETIPVSTWFENEGFDIIDSDGSVSWDEIVYIDVFGTENYDEEYKEEVFGPGVIGEYHCYLENKSNYDIDIQLVIEEQDHEAGAIPLVYRLKTAEGEYLTGEEYLPEEEFEIIKKTIKANTSPELILEWQWPYESGNDELDTTIGSADNLEHIVTFTFYAEADSGITLS